MAQPVEMSEPAVSAPPSGMSISEAMDTLDEFHIKRSDYDRVMQALEAVYGGNDEPEAAPDADNKGPEAAPDEQMANELFAPGRNRKDYA